VVARQDHDAIACAAKESLAESDEKVERLRVLPSEFVVRRSA
jgi:hypothetical protein